MKISIKKIIYILFIFILLINIFSCNKNDKRVGHGEKGVVASIDWQEYDEIIEKIRNLGKTPERDYYLHKAEEMLMDEACVIPIYYRNIKTLCRKSLNGIYVDKKEIVHFEDIYTEDNRKIVNIQVSEEPKSIDPALTHYTTEQTYLLNMYGSLVNYDKNDKIKNVFLDYYEISDDELTWKLVLKDNLKWSDGVPLTAYDFEFTLKRNAKPETGCLLSYVLNVIDGFPNDLNVKAVDEKTLVIKLKNRCPYFLSLLVSNPYMPLREDIVTKSKDWCLEVPNITSGPYILKKWNHKESMVLEKNPYYFDADNIKIDCINLMLNSNTTSVYNAYKSDDIDFAYSVANNVQDNDIIPIKTMGVSYFKINVKNKLFEGLTREEAKKLRKAIAYCIDRNFIIDMFYGTAEKTYTLINDLYVDFEDKPFSRNTKDYTYPYENGYFEDLNLEKARKLLKEIGYHFDNEGKVIEDISFELMTSINNYDIMSIIQFDLARIGINMKIRKKDDALANAGKYCMMFSGWIPDYDNPLALLELFTTDNSNNICFIGRDYPKKNN